MSKAITLPKMALASFVLLIGLFLAIPAQSEESYGAKQAQFKEMYAQLLDDPSNTDLTLQYAELAAELGDYEAAVSPLERLLMSNPDVPKIRLELGILYYLLGSYDMAKTYLQEAKQAQSAKPEIIEQADEYLQRM